MKNFIKKTGFSSRAVYIALCAGVLAVGAITAVGYRVAVGSLTKDILPTPTEKQEPLDMSEVDAILSGVPKEEQSEEEIPIFDLTKELETLFYKQAVVFPVQGEIIGEFSWGELVKATDNMWKTHDGVDIAAEEGTPVKAMTSGTVTDIYKDPIWGNCIVIDHGDTTVGYYFGLSEHITVTKGMNVNSGDVIGAVGNSADIESDLGPHLHFALKRESVWIDPISYIEPVK